MDKIMVIALTSVRLTPTVLRLVPYAVLALNAVTTVGNLFVSHAFQLELVCFKVMHTHF